MTELGTSHIFNASASLCFVVFTLLFTVAFFAAVIANPRHHFKMRHKLFTVSEGVSFFHYTEFECPENLDDTQLIAYKNIQMAD